MDLPQHVQAVLGVTAPITEEDLAIHGAAIQFGQTAFGLSGSEFAAAAANATSAQKTFTIRPAARPPLSWKYLEVSHDGSVECAAVCTPDGGGVLPPTAASQVLVGGWFFEPTLLVGQNIAPRQVVQSAKSSSAVAAFPLRLLKAWAEVCPVLDGCTVPPVWVSKNQIQFMPSSRIQAVQVPNLWFQDVFIEAVSEVKTKWRYLSLYRIFEHGYVSDVWDMLKSDFFFSPKESLAAATNSLETELNQFLGLVQNAGLDNHFATLHDEFHLIRSSGNRFAAALERSFHQTGQHKAVKGRDQKGVLISYKIRCAIVHAGISSPIFDAYPDGVACLEALLPTYESAVLQFLGITAV